MTRNNMASVLMRYLFTIRIPSIITRYKSLAEFHVNNL